MKRTKYGKSLTADSCKFNISIILGRGLSVPDEVMTPALMDVKENSEFYFIYHMSMLCMDKTTHSHVQTQ